MSQLFEDAFTDSAGTALSAHAPVAIVAMSWTAIQGSNGKISGTGTIYFDSTAASQYDAAPALSETVNTIFGQLVLKAGAVATEGAYVYVRDSGGSSGWILYYSAGTVYLKDISNTVTHGSFVFETPSAIPGTYDFRAIYDSVANTVDVVFDGASFQATGVGFGNTVGVGHLNGNAASTSTAGMHFDNIRVTQFADTGGPPNYPIEGDVRSGTSFGPDFSLGGNLVIPAESIVLSGNSFGTSGTEFSGEVSLPAAGEVLLGVTFGPAFGFTTGTVVLPATTNVKAGVLFGAGSALEGTYTASGSLTPPDAPVIAGSHYPTPLRFVGFTRLRITAAAGANIYYAFDGRDPYPPTLANLYNEPVTIRRTTEVRAVAVLNGLVSTIVRARLIRTL